MKREVWIWAAATAAGCLLVLLAAGRVWVTADVAGGQGASATGGQLNGGLTTVALAGLAGVVAVLATKGAGRRVIGALLALCGAGLAWLTYTAVSGQAAAEWARTQSVLQGLAEPALTFDVLWPVVSGAGAALVLAGGVLAVVRGGAWGSMSARYDRKPAAARASDERSMWDAIDRGDDPTQ